MAFEVRNLNSLDQAPTQEQINAFNAQQNGQQNPLAAIAAYDAVPLTTEQRVVEAEPLPVMDYSDMQQSPLQSIAAAQPAPMPETEYAGSQPTGEMNVFERAMHFLKMSNPQYAAKYENDRKNAALSQLAVQAGSGQIDQNQLLQRAAAIDPERYLPSLLDNSLAQNNPDIQLDRQLKQAQLYKAIADARDAGRPDPSKAVENETNLRKEFDSLTKPFRDSVRPSYQKLMAAEDSAAGDIALTYGFMKIQDPGSTVMQGEYATAENAAGIPERIRGQYNKALTGERLTPSQRAEFKNQATAQYKSQLDTYKQAVGRYSGLADSYGYDPTRIVTEYDDSAISKPSPQNNSQPQEVRYNKQGQRAVKRDGKWYIE